MNPELKHPLPCNREAEQFVLGAILLDNGVIPQALYELSMEDFLFGPNRPIFVAMRSLNSRGDVPINPITLQDELVKQGTLDEVGGPAYIAGLFDGIPRFSDIRGYVKIVKECSLKRKAIHLGNWLVNEAFAPDTRIEDLLSALQDKVEGLRESQSVDDLISSEVAVTRAMTSLEERWETGRDIIGMSTGFKDLDQNLLGIRGGKYYLLAAGTGIGKTTLALNIAHNFVIEDSSRVGLVISLEMGTDELVVKYLSTATRLNSYNIETGRMNDQEKKFVREKAEELKRMPIEYVEGFSKVTATSLTTRVSKVRRKYGRIDFLVVDYLQLLDAETGYENEHARLTEISRTLKRIALKENIPVIVLSQLNRDHMKRANRDYMLSDLRGSGSIEQDSDLVLFLMPEDWTAPDDPRRRLLIAKHRGGKPNLILNLIFFGDQSRFESAASHEQGQYSSRTENSHNQNGYRANLQKSVKSKVQMNPNVMSIEEFEENVPW